MNRTALESGYIDLKDLMEFRHWLLLMLSFSHPLGAYSVKRVYHLQAVNHLHVIERVVLCLYTSFIHQMALDTSRKYHEKLMQLVSSHG